MSIKNGKGHPRCIYLSGKMTGLPDHPEKFRMAKQIVRKAYPRAKIVSPPDLPGEDGSITWSDAMRRDIVLICQKVDLIVTLPNWHHSRGAKIEVDLARHLGIDVVHLARLQAPEPDGDIPAESIRIQQAYAKGRRQQVDTLTA